MKMHTKKKIPLVSVVIPSYNRATLITQTLISVCNQTYDNLEIIVVDDGSKDNTAAVVQKFIADYSGPKNLKLLQQANSGAPVARNNGFAHSNGEFVVFFDSDDIMLADRIRLQVEEMLRTNSDMCACGFYINQEGGDSYIPPVLNDSPLGQNIKKELSGGTQSWMFRKSLISEVDGYDVSLKCKQDVDLVFRVLLLNPKVCVVRKALSIFIKHDGEERIMLSTNNLKGLDSILRYHIKIVNYCIEHEGFGLYATAVKNLAQDLSLICKLGDLFSDRLQSALNVYITKRKLLTKILLGYCLTYKYMLSPEVRQKLKNLWK